VFCSAHQCFRISFAQLLSSRSNFPCLGFLSFTCCDGVNKDESHSLALITCSQLICFHLCAMLGAHFSILVLGSLHNLDIKVWRHIAVTQNFAWMAKTAERHHRVSRLSAGIEFFSFFFILPSFLFPYLLLRKMAMKDER